MNPGAKLQKASADRVHTSNPILLFALDAGTRNMLLELAGQIFFEFSRPHGQGGLLLTIGQGVVKQSQTRCTQSLEKGTPCGAKCHS